jgi:hypothetical protein
MMATRALGARGQVELTHCGQPMAWRGSSTTWMGKPGQGTQNNVLRMECEACGATVMVEQREPDEGQHRHLRAV